MSYLVLARKYRPHDFTEMMGQEHVLRALQNALTNERLHHAYLFTGTRGVGKTTVARIFAKSLNCEKGISPTPCGECSTCIEIDSGRYIDLLEIDAASRTKVEDTRDLLDNVQYAPQRGRFKIYLIDEVHMLSGHSFNALLKTLEEPPPHVKFLLATTDPQKLPVTVLSRCLQFHLKNMTQPQITDQLKNVLDKEKIQFELPALEIIAKAASGSMRDALSLMDQCIAYGQNSILEKDVAELLGLTSSQQVIELLEMIKAHNKEKLISIVNTLAETRVDFLNLLDDIIILLQDMAINGGSISPEDIQLYYQIALIGKRDLPLCPDQKLGFLMCLIRMMVFTPGKMEIKKAVKNTDSWQDLIPALNLSGLSQLLAQNCTFKKQDGEIILTVDESQKALSTPLAQEKLIQALQAKFGNTCKISFIIGKSSDTPAKREQKAVDDARQKVQSEVLSDPTVQSLMQTFSATLENISEK